VEGTIPTTSDSRSYKGCPLDLSRTPSAIRRPRRPPLGFPSPVSRPPKRGVWKCCMALPRTSAHPVTGWLKIFGEKVGSLRSTRITGLHRYYEPVRPCAPHRYSAPYGFAASEVSLSIGTQVPTFRTRACSRDRAAQIPVAAQPVGRLPLGLVPGVGTSSWFRQRLEFFSIRHQRFTYVRLPATHLTGSSRLFPQRSPPRPLCRSSLRWFGP
jgi:hypothetical protein